MIPFPLIFAKIGAGVAFILGIFFMGYSHGKKEVQGEWDVQKMAVVQHEKEAILKAVADNEEEHDLNLRVSNEVLETQSRKLHESQDRITAERATNDGLRYQITVAKRTCVAKTGETASTVRADDSGTTETVELPKETQRGLQDIAEDADREVSRLQIKVGALQDWLVKEGFSQPRSSNP